MSYMTLSSQKQPLFKKRIPLWHPFFFYSVRTFARIRQHYFSKYCGGRMHGPSPTSNFWWDRPPQSTTLGLRLWLRPLQRIRQGIERLIFFLHCRPNSGTSIPSIMHVVYSPYFHKIYWFPPISAKFIKSPCFRLDFLLNLRCSLPPILTMMHLGYASCFTRKLLDASGTLVDRFK